MLGRMVLVPAQIQFHELGHALLAWLSARAALPLPFGFTFWREQQSVFTGACMVFLLGVLFFGALRERRPFGAVLAGLLLLAFVVLTFVIPAATSLMLLLLAGLAGELVLTSLTIIAFYFPLPDRVRWDFFRFVLLVPAVACWLSSALQWWRIAEGQEALPTGSILGTAGDGSGDLDRLLAQYDFSEASLTVLYVRLAQLTLGCLALTYGVFAWRAVHKLWPDRGFSFAQLWPTRRKPINRFAARRMRARQRERG
ncbi:MAG: hypothetical protein JWN48_5025 [Myxococcaceae bacterium]|nr:hypothetical protein [Myxococcaceae bacterium]